MHIKDVYVRPVFFGRCAGTANATRNEHTAKQMPLASNREEERKFSDTRGKW